MDNTTTTTTAEAVKAPRPIAAKGAQAKALTMRVRRAAKALGTRAAANAARRFEGAIKAESHAITGRRAREFADAMDKRARCGRYAAMGKDEATAARDKIVARLTTITAEAQTLRVERTAVTARLRALREQEAAVKRATAEAKAIKRLKARGYSVRKAV